MDFNNEFARKIFDDIFNGANEPKPENKIDADEVAKPLFDMFSGFVKAGFTEEQAMDLIKFMIVTAFKMKQ